MATEPQGHVHAQECHFERFKQPLWNFFVSQLILLREKYKKLPFVIYFIFDPDRSGDLGILLRGYVETEGFERLTQQNRYSGGEYASLCNFYFLKGEIQEIIDMFTKVEDTIKCLRKRVRIL